MANKVRAGRRDIVYEGGGADLKIEILGQLGERRRTGPGKMWKGEWFDRIMF
jgi:hypothetical protein